MAFTTVCESLSFGQRILNFCPIKNSIKTFAEKNMSLESDFLKESFRGSLECFSEYSMIAGLCAILIVFFLSSLSSFIKGDSLQTFKIKNSENYWFKYLEKESVF
jgi:hypothetical protein